MARWRPEFQRAVRLAFDLISLLVNGAMVPATEQREIRERRRSAVGPMLEVMTFDERHVAARKPTGTVTALQCASQGRRNRPRPRADLEQIAVLVVPHHHPARITCEP